MIGKWTLIPTRFLACVNNGFYTISSILPMLLPIITEPNSLLHQPARELPKSDISASHLKRLLDNMAETMHFHEGVGIAAPQAGESVRLCLIAKNYNPLDARKDLALINPYWKKTSLFKAWGEEGCLSVPGICGQVKRYKKIEVWALDENGESVHFAAEDFLARVIQHEVDHLNGILFIEKAKDLRAIEKQP